MPNATHDFHDILNQLRKRARERRPPQEAPAALSSAGRAADLVAAIVGSWRFIAIQSALLVGWIVFNAVSPQRVDPYPFILLNLLLSFQAAYTAPIIMMSQNRKAELEIETLHEKIDLLREKEIAALAAAVDRLTRMLEDKGART
jgi:uncharacterized membrane protein